MSFYLEWGDDIVYISDSYLRREILNGTKSSIATSQLLDTRENLLLTKLGVKIPIVSIDELLDVFFKYINKDNIDELSVIMDFNRSHMLSILYLLYQSRISIDDVKDIISSSSYNTRSEMLLSHLSEQGGDSINVLMPLFELMRKLSNYSNRFELAETKGSMESIKNSLSTSKIDNLTYVINQGNYFYENLSRNDGKSLLKYCNKWNNIPLPNDGKSTSMFPRSDSALSSYSFVNAATSLGNASTTSLNFVYTENLISRSVLFDSNFDKFKRITSASLRFGKWWHYWWESAFDFKLEDVTVGTKFTARSIKLEKGDVEADAISTLLAEHVKDKFNKRLNRNELNNINKKADDIIKHSMAVHFNHGLRLGIDDDDIGSIGGVYSQNIYNIYSMYDSLINNTSRYRYSRLNPSLGSTTLLNSSINTPLCLNGDAVGADTEKVTIERKGRDLKYTMHTGYIDILGDDTSPNNILIANTFSNITNVNYSLDEEGKVIKNEKNIPLNNRYFIKNHLSYLPIDFEINIKDLALLPFVELISINGASSSIMSSINNLKDYLTSIVENIKSSTSRSYTTPSFYGLSHLFKYDYLMAKDDDGAYFANFGTTDFYTPLVELITRNNINTEFDLETIQNDPYGAIGVLKSNIDVLYDSFTPETDKEKFVTIHSLNMLKKYIDNYLLNDETEDIEVVLRTDAFYYKVYVLLFLMRHSVISLKDVRNAIFKSNAYIRLNNDPFRDNTAIRRIESFYNTYIYSPTIIRHITKYNIYPSRISNMYVGKISNRDILLKL